MPIQIKKGDTLSKLVANYNKAHGTKLTVAQVAEANKLKDPNKIIAGKSLSFDSFEAKKPTTEAKATTDAKPTPESTPTTQTAPTTTAAVTAPTENETKGKSFFSKLKDFFAKGGTFEKGLMALQEQLGISATGKYGPETADALTQFGAAIGGAILNLLQSKFASESTNTEPKIKLTPEAKTEFAKDLAMISAQQGPKAAAMFLQKRMEAEGVPCKTDGVTDAAHYAALDAAYGPAVAYELTKAVAGEVKPATSGLDFKNPAVMAAYQKKIEAQTKALEAEQRRPLDPVTYDATSKVVIPQEPSPIGLDLKNPTVAVSFGRALAQYNQAVTAARNESQTVPPRTAPRITVPREPTTQGLNLNDPNVMARYQEDVSYYRQMVALAKQQAGEV